MSVVGVDGCRSGWFWVCLTRRGKWEAGIDAEFSRVWSRWRQADSILVDIPIGLRDSGNVERLCDREARRILGAPRSSSVFPAPCRPALCAGAYRDGSRINERHTGRRLSRQSWNIVGKIREMDDLLRPRHPARNVVREIHPEILFWALHGGEPMRHNKRTEEGYTERIRVLTRHYSDSEEIVACVLSTLPRKDVGKDDVLDALAAAVTARLGARALRSLPEHPERDSAGLPMEIVYAGRPA